MKQKKDFFMDSLHLFVLFSFVFAPLYDLLSRQAEFFAIRRSRPFDIILFVLILSFVLPLVVVLSEVIVRQFFGKIFQRGLHGLLAAILITSAILPMIKRVHALPGTFIVVITVVIGIAAAIAYIEFSPVRTFLSVLAPAIIIFPGIFLFHSPVSKIVFMKDDPGKISTKVDTTIPVVVNTATPVVMVIFDEFPVTSLMDERHQIDAHLYPNFAALADDSYWFRNATTVSGRTEDSVTAILTGNYPQGSSLPTVVDHPYNLFTLLSTSYDVKAIEPVTQLCPHELCGDDSSHENIKARVYSLLSDISVIYLHVLLPQDLTTGLPSISGRWTDFIGSINIPKDFDYREGRFLRFKKFLESIHSTNRPALFFLHIILPHHPWNYLPSGKLYNKTFEAPHRWDNDEWKTIIYLQRHLLQVGFIDKLLGELIDKLKSENLYDRSLIVITADHGVSFLPNDESRTITKTNYQDILPVPLLIKAPKQRKGVIIDRDVETIDILPAIADILGIKLPWKTDGLSAINQSISRQSGAKVIVSEPVLEAKYKTLDRKLSIFGSDANADLFKFGPNKKLIGEHLNEINSQKIEGVEIEIDSTHDYDPDAAFVPALVKGRVIDRANPRTRYDIAIAINGTIGAVTRTFTEEGMFSAIVPETFLKPGKNDIEAIILSQVDDRSLLAQGRDQTNIAYSLSSRKNEEIITSSDGRVIKVVQGYLNGTVNNVYEFDGELVFTGWAVDVKNIQVPQAILIFIDGKFFYSGRLEILSPGLAEKFGNDALRWSGFKYAFSPDQFNEKTNIEVRFFAISKYGSATELNYYKGYKWGPHV